MSYSIVLGDLGPIFPVTLTDDGVPFVLDPAHHTATLRYEDPTGTVHAVVMTIQDTNGIVNYTWLAGDLPVAGTYQGIVKLTRNDSDMTYPRTFPNDGSKIVWTVWATI